MFKNSKIIILFYFKFYKEFYKEFSEFSFYFLCIISAGGRDGGPGNRAGTQQDKNLLKEATAGNDYVIKSFHGAEKIRKLITKQDKIVIPTTLQKRLVEWYHNQLCHPGKNRTEKTIGQHFTWKGLQKMYMVFAQNVIAAN